MRFYILDDLVSPTSRNPLRVEPGARVSERDGPPVDKCARWCGLHGASADSVTNPDCGKCSRLWIEQGTLRENETSYPIVDGIPRFVDAAGSGLDAQTQESASMMRFGMREVTTRIAVATRRRARWKAGLLSSA